MAERQPDLKAQDETDLDFRWTAFFQRTTQPLFVLNRRRQVLFVNRAFEQLIGITAREMRMQACKRQKDPAPGSREAALHALAPPREVSEGRSVRVRRLLSRNDASPTWLQLEFLPFTGPQGFLGVMGAITHASPTVKSATQPLPEKLVNLRQRLADWHSLEEIPSQLPAMRQAVAQARLVSRTRVPALIIGEAGVGKEWLARAIHLNSGEDHASFVSLDCRRLPPIALAWALYGSHKASRRPGLTLYLRDPSYLPRELQERLCEDFADADAGPSLPRLLAGTESDPTADVQAGRLTDSFHCLLATMIIRLPPLRDRLADLPDLVGRLLHRISSGSDDPVTELTPQAWEIVQSHKWPGNLRELFSVLATAVTRAKGDKIDAVDLPVFLHASPVASPRELPLDSILEQAERRLIEWALVSAKGNKSRAAELLAISRPRLMRRMEALGIEQHLPDA